MLHLGLTVTDANQVSCSLSAQHGRLNSVTSAFNPPCLHLTHKKHGFACKNEACFTPVSADLQKLTSINVQCVTLKQDVLFSLPIISTKCG